jgi:hypothetical protein
VYSTAWDAGSGVHSDISCSALYISPMISDTDQWDCSATARGKGVADASLCVNAQNEVHVHIVSSRHQDDPDEERWNNMMSLGGMRMGEVLIEVRDG